MQLNSDFGAANPGAWLVSNGNVTVGPVETGLLLRGVTHGRIPSDSWVRQVGWQHWRELRNIREVSGLTRSLELPSDGPGLGALTFHGSAGALAHASDAGEVLLIALHALAHATSATVGLGHRVREPLFLPTTSCVFEAALDRLGEVLPWSDPAFSLARNGRVRLLPGSGRPGGTAHRVAQRLSPDSPLLGLAVLPILVSGELHAILELGRSDHPFRASDELELSSFAERVSVALVRTGVTPRTHRC